MTILLQEVEVDGSLSLEILRNADEAFSDPGSWTLDSSFYEIKPVIPPPEKHASPTPAFDSELPYNGYKELHKWPKRRRLASNKRKAIPRATSNCLADRPGMNIRKERNKRSDKSRAAEDMASTVAGLKIAKIKDVADSNMGITKESIPLRPKSSK
jgi:hypothetical protein